MVGVKTYMGKYYYFTSKYLINSLHYSIDAKVLHDGVERSNLLYGAKNLEVTKVINVHGSIDPWHAAGVYKNDIQELSPTIFIEGR